MFESDIERLPQGSTRILSRNLNATKIERLPDPAGRPRLILMLKFPPDGLLTLLRYVTPNLPSQVSRGEAA